MSGDFINVLVVLTLCLSAIGLAIWQPPRTSPLATLKWLIAFILCLLSYYYVVNGVLFFFIALVYPLWAVLLTVITFKLWRWRGAGATVLLVIGMPLVVMNKGFLFEKFYCKSGKIGDFIYEKSSNVPGFFDATHKAGCFSYNNTDCSVYLKDKGYLFYESQLSIDQFDEIQNIWGSPPLPMREGFFRYRLTDNFDDARCQDFFDRLDWIKSKKGNEKYDILYDLKNKGYCISVEEIQKPTSQYTLMNRTEESNYILWKVKSIHVSIRDNNNKKLMAETKNLFWAADSIFYFHNKFSNSGSCSASLETNGSLLDHVIPSALNDNSLRNQGEYNDK